MVVKATNKRKAQKMFFLLVAIAILENFETVKPSVDVFNSDSVLG